jgi:hypothetical protein
VPVIKISGKIVNFGGLQEHLPEDFQAVTMMSKGKKSTYAYIYIYVLK